MDMHIQHARRIRYELRATHPHFQAQRLNTSSFEETTRNTLPLNQGYVADDL